MQTSTKVHAAVVKEAPIAGEAAMTIPTIFLRAHVVGKEATLTHTQIAFAIDKSKIVSIIKLSW